MKKILLFVMLFCSLNVFAAKPDKKVIEVLEKQLTAIQKNDYNLFMANSTEKFKSLSPKAFEGVVEEMSKKLASGHESVFLTTLNQDGYFVYLWKITYKDKSDDNLSRLIIDKENKISGFWIQ